MRVLATCNCGYPGTEIEEELEFPDGTPDEAIDEAVHEWAEEQIEIESSWEIIEEGDDDYDEEDYD